MSENISCIKDLFQTPYNIRIPAYQRAYTWEKDQWNQFFDDLIEQNGKKYYLGQFIFEKNENTLYIIDGQQRLTTTIIFLSVIADIKENRKENNNEIKILYLTDKFKTIEDDQIIFKKVTQKHFSAVLDDTETLSQKRITNASVFFREKLSNLEPEIFTGIQNTLEMANINVVNITNKTEAIQVFEYQNNRGKDLSHFEIIKAYLMHQIYLNAINLADADDIISEIQGVVSKTYRYLESVEGYFSETELLNNYCDLFYNINSNINSIKSKLSDQKDKLSWIKLFFENFAEIAFSAKNVVKSKEDKIGITNLFFIGNEVNWKLVLLAIFNKGENSGEKFTSILKLLEVLCFKLKLGDFRTDYLRNYIRQYYFNSNYTLDNLYNDIRNATDVGFKWYWNNGNNFKNIILKYFDENTYHYHRHIIKYVLWQYENALRIKNGSGALLDNDLYKIYTIEHIAPQHPTGGNSEEFEQKYLNLVGNLALLTQTQNSRFSNKSYNEKNELFQDTALTSYTEIREKQYWTEEEILGRYNNISTFIKNYFDLTNL
jgi:hypothetical protein